MRGWDGGLGGESGTGIGDRERAQRHKVQFGQSGIVVDFVFSFFDLYLYIRTILYSLYYIKYVLNGIVLFHESFKSSKAAFLGNQSSAGFAAMLPHLSFASGKLPPHAEPCLVGKTCTVGNTVGYVEFRAGADDYLALNNWYSRDDFVTLQIDFAY